MRLVYSSNRPHHNRQHPVFAFASHQPKPEAQPAVSVCPDGQTTEVCPFCESIEVIEIRRNGLHDQIAVLRCIACQREWPEIDEDEDDVD